MENRDLLYEILLSREQRALKQRELIDQYGYSLISFTLNIPGPVKDSPLYRDIHQVGMKTLLDLIEVKNLKTAYKETIHKTTGPEGYICVDIDPVRLKRYVIMIEENHQLGRIFDFDIIDKEGSSISRNNMNINSRQCLICDEQALICKRMQHHSIEELINKINEISNEYFID